MKKVNSGWTAAMYVFLFFTADGLAQNCPVTFESNAGPDIDVCRGGQVNLYGTIGGSASQGEWKGGKGTFNPNRTSLETSYTPADDETGVIELTLEAFNPRYKTCAPVRSTIKLRMHTEPHISAGGDRRIAIGNRVMLGADLKGDAQGVTWKSSGSGTFSDANSLVAEYFPSKEDLESRNITLTIAAEPWPGCMPDSAQVTITFYKNPVQPGGKEKQNR